MTTSSDVPRTMVLRGTDAARVRPARMAEELRRSRYVGLHGLDPRLVDGSLEAVVAQAQEEAGKLGWEAGHREGREAALREAAREAEAARSARDERDRAERATREAAWARLEEALERAAAELARRQAPVLEELDHQVATAGVDIARALVGHHLRVADRPALEAVQRALALAPRGATAVVRLHPDDLDQVPDVATLLPGGTVTLAPDPSVERGGCLVDAGDRCIDAQLGRAVERLEEVLRA